MIVGVVTPGCVLICWTKITFDISGLLKNIFIVFIYQFNGKNERMILVWGLGPVKSFPLGSIEFWIRIFLFFLLFFIPFFALFSLHCNQVHLY